MTAHKKSNYFHAAIPLLLGLITSQIIATVQVYISNLDLHAALKLMNDAGYLTVPNQNVMLGLEKVAPAFCGGVFFTLSIGAGISLFSLLPAWMWHHLFSRHRHWLIPFLMLWAALLIAVNLHGFHLFVTLYFLAIPPIVFGSALILCWRQNQHHLGRHLLVHLIPVVILTILWFTQYDRNLFVDLRDFLLFSNPIGKKVTGFYYNYTLYAAEAFKSLDQKLLKTCRLEIFSNKTLARSVKKVLIKYDYLPVETDASVDLNVVEENHRLLFEHHGRAILQTTARDLRTKPGYVLSRFSTGIDRFSMFRQITFISLLIGYPLTLYLLFHALVWFIINLFIDSRKAAIVSSILCFGISLCILAVFYFSRSPQLSEHELAEALSSDRWQVRVAALRFIEASKMEIGQFKNYHQMVTSSQISEKYWLAKTLAHSRQADTNKVLLTLSNDSNANVVSMAFWALAQRKDTRVIEKILQKIRASDNWYSQLYAYRALRSLGWYQSQSQ
jgi:hypothetical protein